MTLTSAEKKAQRALHPNCYLCQALGVPFSELAGYEDRHIQYDHWLPQGRIGGSQADLVANQLPMHAHPQGLGPLEPGWAQATKRNCHRGKGNKFTGQEWTEYVTICQRVAKTDYSDDLMSDRNQADSAYDVEISWNQASGEATMLGKTYPLMLQRVGNSGEEWLSFSTVLPPTLLWRDLEVQSRGADHERLAKLAWHLKSNPLLSPILCRWAERRLYVFDGNHRLCAFILARQDHPVPVVIFDGPDPKRFLEVAAEAHESLTQMKYQFTEKALKFSALNEQELAEAEDKYGEAASEALAWKGLRPTDVKLRIAGRLSGRLDGLGGWRLKWKALGVTDPSWNEFISTYARLSAETAPFVSDMYLREEEFENLSDLCRIFDEELFDQLDSCPEVKASLKTKWWKRAHHRFSTRLGQVVKDNLELGNTPPAPAYTPRWNDYVRSRVRLGVENWRESPAWREATAANNEFDIDNLLTARGFTEAYLIP
ncbi:MAG: ParB N-terminal domain-containing protein [Dehalococcoidia bacterium]|nr:ParB N-terminal domain-containing protein [Dehalococcoidia bacterium]